MQIPASHLLLVEVLRAAVGAQRLGIQRARTARDARQPRCWMLTEHPAPANLLSQANLDGQGGLDFLSVIRRSCLMMSKLISTLVLIPGLLYGGEPLVKKEYCPSGYWERGDYCYPMDDEEVIVRPEETSCPSGYWARGNYCFPIKSQHR
jgi:hypothetical protein